MRLTRDGAAGAYSRPTISRDGKRIAFKRGERGRAYTARLKRRSLSDVTRIGPAPDGARDATQFDVAISPDGKRVAWVELRVNVVFNTIDYRRYMANADGSSPRQVASSGGRPFVAFYDNSRILREGLTEAVDAMQEGESVDSGLCVPSPATRTQRHLPRRGRRAAGRLRRRRAPSAPPCDVPAPRPAGRHRVHVGREASTTRSRSRARSSSSTCARPSSSRTSRPGRATAARSSRRTASASRSPAARRSGRCRRGAARRSASCARGTQPAWGR